MQARQAYTFVLSVSLVSGFEILHCWFRERKEWEGFLVLDRLNCFSPANSVHLKPTTNRGKFIFSATTLTLCKQPRESLLCGEKLLCAKAKTYTPAAFWLYLSILDIFVDLTSFRQQWSNADVKCTFNNYDFNRDKDRKFLAAGIGSSNW